MKFGMFLELQYPKPWLPGGELQLFQDNLDHDDATARARGLDAYLFFQMAVSHHYVFGVHKPGRVNLWEQYEAVKHLLEPTLPPGGGPTAIGTPDHAREVMHEWVDAGADQVCFIAQGGKAKHEHILQSLELFATHVMPEIAQGEEEREAKKLKELGAYIDAAMERKVWMQPLADEDIPRYSAYRPMDIRQLEQKSQRITGRWPSECSWSPGVERCPDARISVENPKKSCPSGGGQVSSAGT